MDPFDTAVVGAGPAGLAAALAVARAGRRVLLADDGRGRNAPADRAWNIVTRDGTPPSEIRALGRAELGRYDVTVHDGAVCAARCDGADFALELDGGEAARARTLVLATGVADLLPNVPGVREGWGRGVVHCPYCHGWEHRGEPTALLAEPDDAFEQGRFLTLWTDDLTVLTNGDDGLTSSQRAELDARGVRVDERPVGRVETTPEGDVTGVVFEDGGRLDVQVVYVKTKVRPHSDLAESLGARLDPARIVCTDAHGRVEGVPGLYVCGDATEHQHQVVFAMASGMRAAFALNHDLMLRDTPEIAAEPDEDAAREDAAGQDAPEREASGHATASR